MSCLHPLHSDMPKPERFTFPFCYEPHPLCILAAEEVKREIERINPTEGKMFGVMVVQEGDSRLAFLAAYSGLLEGRNDWDYFVPPVFDAQQPDGYFKTREREIMQSEAHRQMSQDLQLWLFRQYRMLNARGQVRDLVEIWQDYHPSPRIRSKYPLPPSGTGDCCAPKLLQYAYQHGLKPVCMAEFWWGSSPKSEVRHHGEFYPACRGKCKPVLTWMLQGLDVDPDPEKARLPRLHVQIVYEDEALAVVNKPAGMLSVPGRRERYSVAVWAQRRWEGAILVHRLDMWTSGLLLVAKTMEAYHHLQRQFEEHTVKKKYLALVEGAPAVEHGVIDLPLSSDPINHPRQVVDYEHGKRAITEYRVLTRGDMSLLALWPHTGRTHQLRMHCAHPDGLGCPIVGDELYGHKSDRLYLQAQAIAFAHPVTGKRMHFELPDSFSLS
jgi:tRNA pseudouridine32 synthase/23S rRNA pseudouridine746 synthase